MSTDAPSFPDGDHLLVSKKNSAGHTRAQGINALIFEALLNIVVPLEGCEMDAAKALTVTTPCCLSCYMKQNPMPSREYYVRELFPEENVVLLQSLDDDGASLAAQVMDVKCTYWNVGRESDALLQHAGRVSAGTGRLHAGNLWAALVSLKDSVRENIVDMSNLHQKHCERSAGQTTEEVVSVCMKTLRISHAKLVRFMVHKDINERRRRWARDSPLRFSS
jgi:hypothetical protein